jgi:hypothetical protein
LAAASTAQTAAASQQTATNLVGHNVTYTDSSGDNVSGYVTAANLSGTTPSLVINGGDIGLSSITQVLANAGGTGTGTSTSTT